MNICFVCNEYPPASHGGIGTVTQTLARGLVQNGHIVKVIGVYPESSSILAYELDQGVEVWRLTKTNKRSYYGWIIDRIKLFKIIQQWANSGEIDLVELPDWQGMAAFWPNLPIPIVIRSHGSSSYFQSELGRSINKTTFFLERASLRRAFSWCAVSKYVALKTKSMFKLNLEAEAILYNPVNIPNEVNLYANRHQEKVIFTGTLTQKKGVVSLIDAWPMVIQKHPKSSLDIYGKDGLTENGSSMRSLLEKRLSRMIYDSVTFFGHVEREMVLTALSSSRVAVFPSFAEAFAMAPLEAMACSCPTIYSNSGPGLELIENEVNGLLVDPKDPQNIAEAIITLLDNENFAIQLGNSGRKHVEENFSDKVLLPLNIDYYKKTIDNFSKKSIKKLEKLENQQ